MTVYVDDARISARVGHRQDRWSHLFADTPAELHAFAQSIGLLRSWFQDPTKAGKPIAKPGSRAAENWHYDVTDSKRKLAIARGAQPVTTWKAVEIISDRYARRHTEPHQLHIDFTTPDTSDAQATTAPSTPQPLRTLHDRSA